MSFVAPRQSWGEPVDGTLLGIGPHWIVLEGVVLAPWLNRVVFKDTFPLSAEDPVVLLRHCGIWCHSFLGGSAKYHRKAQLYSSLEKLRVSPKVMQLVVSWDVAGYVLL